MEVLLLLFEQLSSEDDRQAGALWVLLRRAEALWVLLLLHIQHQLLPLHYSYSASILYVYTRQDWIHILSISRHQGISSLQTTTGYKLYHNYTETMMQLTLKHSVAL